MRSAPAGDRKKAIVLAVLVCGWLVVILRPPAARGAITAVDPGAASVAPGGSASAIITLTSLGSCLSAVTPPAVGITVSFDPACGSGASWQSTMTVSTLSTTPAGDYLITITELAEGIELPDLRTWTLTVTSSASTTAAPTTTSTTTTLVSSTTTTSTPTTSSTTPMAGAATTSPTPSTSGPTTTVTAVGGGHPGGPDTGGPDDSSAVATNGLQPPAEEATSLSEPSPEPASFSPMTGSVARVLGVVLPPWAVETVISPLLVVELTARALLASSAALLIPSGLLVAYVLFSLRRDSSFSPLRRLSVLHLPRRVGRAKELP